MENEVRKDSQGKIAFIFIVFLALVIRIWGISFGLPYIYHVDEERFSRISHHYFSGDLNPHFFHVPSLHTYAVAGIWGAYYLVGKVSGKFHSLDEFTDSFRNEITTLFILGRMFSVLLSIGTILVVYLIGKRLYNKKVGLLAALFLLFSPVHNKISHYMVPDSPMIFFQMLSFLFIWMIYKKGKWEYYILAGLFAGLAMGTKYGGLLLFLPLILAHVFHVLEDKQPLRNIFLSFKLILSGAFFFVGFFIGCPYAFFDFRSFWRGFQWQSRHLFVTGHYGSSTAQPAWLFYFKHGFKELVGKSSQFLVLGGIIYGLFRHKKREIILFSFPLVQFLIMSNWKTSAVRYLLPLAPFFAIIGAYFLYLILSKLAYYLARFNSKFSFFLKTKGIFASFIVILFLLSPGLKVLRFDYTLTQMDTRTIAKDWIEKNIPQGSRIAFEAYGPPFTREKYDIIYRHTMGRVTLEWLSQRKRDFIIISDIMYARFTRFPEEFPRQAKFYNSLEEAVLIKVFEPEWNEYLIDMHNPTLKIYRLSDYPNFSFPGNFTYYSHNINLTKSKEEWILQSTIRGQGLIKGNEKVKDPYVRIVDSEGKQIVKLIVYKGKIESSDSFIYSNSIKFSSLPAQARVYIGYEYNFSPSPLNYKLEGDFKKEYCLIENLEDQSLRKKKLHSIFMYTALSDTHGEDYHQVVTLSKLKANWNLFSKAFGGELRWGNDYVLNPFVQIVDSEGNEITKMIIYRGKVGSQEAKRRSPVKRSKVVPSLPDNYEIYVGYDYYCDFDNKNRAGGPEKFKIFSSNPKR